MRTSFSLFVVLAACTDARIGEPPGELVCGREWQRSVPIFSGPAIDLMVVIDRTPSMADEVERLADNLDQLAAVLSPIAAGSPPLHVAVVTSDLGGAGVPGCEGRGDDGRFRQGGRCGVEGDYLVVRHAQDGTIAQNFDGTLADTLRCLADVPLSACPVSQPMAAAVRALDGSAPAHDGFRRDGAFLYLLTITDGDDCSIVDDEAFAGVAGATAAEVEAAVDKRCFARGASCAPGNPETPGPHQHCVVRSDAGFASLAASLDVLGRETLFVATASAGAALAVGPDGALTSACSGEATTSATGAPRLATLPAEMPDLWATADVCGDSWEGVLWPLEGLGGWGGWGGLVCADAVIDVEPLVPGIQLDCAASLHDPTTGALVAHLPVCGRGAGDEPCLRLREDLQSCPEGGAVFDIELHERIVPLATQLALSCRVPCD